MENPDTSSHLARLMPRWEHREVHRRRLPASPQRVWDALLDLRVRDLAMTTALTRLRGGPAAWRPGAPMPNGDARVVDSMPPRPLIADKPVELLLVDVARYTAGQPAKPEAPPWTPESFADFEEPGWTKVGMNFRLLAGPDGTELVTETRVISTDAATARRFAAYWLMVRIGSGLIRRDLLRAVGSVLQRQPERQTTDDDGERP